MNKKQIVRLTESDIHSEESYNRAWENLWSQFDKNRKSINWGVYERYKGNPQAIKHWFDKWGIDVNEYLNEARNINKKQIVRLAEQDLHNIVKESVNKVLTELDWRTYANAAKKRDAQIQQLGRDATDKGGNRLTHLRNNLDYAASDALTSKYAQRHNNGHPTNNADVYTKNGYQTVTTNNFDGNGRWSRGRFNYDNKGNVDKQGYDIDSQMDNEVEDYMNGKSKYIKGKGWQ